MNESHVWIGSPSSASYCQRCEQDYHDRTVACPGSPTRRDGHSALRAKPGGGLEKFDPRPKASGSTFRVLFANRYGEDKLVQADRGEVYWKATYDAELSIWNYRGEADFEAIMAIKTTTRLIGPAEVYAAGVAKASRVVQALDDRQENPLR